MRVLVCAGRDFTDARLVRSAFIDCGILPDGARRDVVLVHGAVGKRTRTKPTRSDSLIAHLWRLAGGVDEPHPADWGGRFGKGAGFVRNQEMLDSGIDLCIAFPGGNGTADMVRRCRKAGVPVRQVFSD